MAGPKPIGQSNSAQTAPPTAGSAQEVTRNCDDEDTPPPGVLYMMLESTPPSQERNNWTISVKAKGVDGQHISHSDPGEPCILVEIDSTSIGRTALIVPDPLFTIDEGGAYIRKKRTDLVLVPLATNFRRITLWMNLNEPITDCIGEAGRLTHHIDLGGWDDLKALCESQLDRQLCKIAAGPQCVFHNVKLISIPPTLPHRTTSDQNAQKPDPIKAPQTKQTPIKTHVKPTSEK